MRIGANSLSYNYNLYNNEQQKLQKTMLRLATGQKINSAADNPAALAISEGLRSQINGLSKAQQNTEDARSMLYTAEGSMGNSSDVIQRMRQLTLQSANGTLTDEDRSAIQSEMNQLGVQLDYNANNTEYNTIKTNNGTTGSLSIQTGANSGQNLAISINSATSAALGINTDVSTQAAANSNLSSIDTGLDRLTTSRTNLGALINRLDYTSQNDSQSAVNAQASESHYRDADPAQEISLFNQSNVQMYASIMAMSRRMQNQQGSLLSLLA